MTRQEATGDFQAQPWCKALINDPAFTPLSSRKNSGNALFSETLWTDVTIRAHQSFYRHPPPGQSTGGEVRLLLSLGSGLDGWSGICHGGILTLIFDDTIHELARKEMAADTATVTLTTRFHKPVRTPAVVLCRAWMEKETMGRKAWINSVIEDGHEGLFATAEAFVVKIKGKL